MTDFGRPIMETLLQRLVTLPIWNVRRSHGSCFLAEFGEQARRETLPARDFGHGRVIPERQILLGAWSLLVTECQWTIAIDGQSTSHLDTDHAHMEAVMRQLDRQRVSDAALDEAGLRLTLGGRGMIRLGPADPVEPTGTGTQWALKMPDGNTLSRDTLGALSLE